MDILQHRWNKTVTFILPLVFQDLTYKDVIFEDFINCYYADVNNTDIVNSVIIEFENSSTHFKIPEYFIDDYKKIINSQYSKISNKSKKIILNFWKQDKKSYLYSVLYKTDKIISYWESKSNIPVSTSEDKEYWPLFTDDKELKGYKSLFKIK